MILTRGSVIEKVSYSSEPETSRVSNKEIKTTVVCSRKRTVLWGNASSDNDREESTIQESDNDVPLSDSEVEGEQTLAGLAGSWRFLRTKKHPDSSFLEVNLNEHPMRSRLELF